MYIIKPQKDANIKFHMVSCSKIMEEVKNDLENRFGSMIIEDIPNRDTYTWDPGGMVYLGKDISPITLDLEGIKFNVLGQHFNDLISAIKNYKPRGNKETYIKIYGKYTCLCISTQQYKNLINLLNDPQVIMKANKDYKKAEYIINNLDGSKIITNGFRDEDGKIHIIKSLTKHIDYKKLN
jgi:hypothetical protein